MLLLVIGCGEMRGALVSRWACKIGISITVADLSFKVTRLATALVNNPFELKRMLFDKVVTAVKPPLKEIMTP